MPKAVVVADMLFSSLLNTISRKGINDFSTQIHQGKTIVKPTQAIKDALI
jgi:hypothetical protein